MLRALLSDHSWNARERGIAGDGSDQGFGTRVRKHLETEGPSPQSTARGQARISVCGAWKSTSGYRGLRRFVSASRGIERSQTVRELLESVGRGEDSHQPVSLHNQGGVVMSSRHLE